MEKQLLTMANISILPATESDVSTILDLIRQLSVYEKLEHMLTGNEAMLHAALFGTDRLANVSLRATAPNRSVSHSTSPLFPLSFVSLACIWRTSLLFPLRVDMV